MTTLSELITETRDRADMPTEAFIDDTELTNMINRSYHTLYDMCILAMGVESFLDGYEFDTVATQTEYGLPSSFYKFVGIDLKTSGVWHSLARYNHSDRNKYLNSTDFFVDGKPRIRYNLKKNIFNLIPAPPDGYNCKVHYVPQITELATGTDSIDSAIPESFVEYIIVDVAAKMLIKEESPADELLQEKQQIMQKIQAAGLREFDTPEASQDADNTLFNLRIQARYKADMVTDQLVTDTEIDHYINQSYGALQDILVKAYGNYYFLDSYDFDTVVDQKDYDLPTNFYKLGGVEVTAGGEKYYIPRYNFQERNWHENDDITTRMGSPYFHYSLYKDKIRLLPAPEEVLSCTIWYTKRLNALTADSDSMSSIIIQDWSEYMLIEVAIKMLTKKLINADPNSAGPIQAAIDQLQNQLMIQKARLDQIVENRDWGQTETSTDARGLARRALWGRW